MGLALVAGVSDTPRSRSDESFEDASGRKSYAEVLETKTWGEAKRSHGPNFGLGCTVIAFGAKQPVSVCEKTNILTVRLEQESGLEIILIYNCDHTFGAKKQKA